MTSKKQYENKYIVARERETKKLEEYNEMIRRERKKGMSEN